MIRVFYRFFKLMPEYKTIREIKQDVLDVMIGKKVIYEAIGCIDGTKIGKKSYVTQDEEIFAITTTEMIV